jgi:hypothetical protein
MKGTMAEVGIVRVSERGARVSFFSGLYVYAGEGARRRQKMCKAISRLNAVVNAISYLAYNRMN